MFNLFGALAQFEREIIRDRTMAGLSAARARGRNGGRPAKLSPDQVRAARRLYDEREHTVEQIGSVLGSAAPLYTSIYRALRDKLAPAKPAAAGPGGGAGRRRPMRRTQRELVADAAASTALEVVSAVGVEGHLPVPSSLVVRHGSGQSWVVEAVGQTRATLRNLAGDGVCATLSSLTPDPVQTADAAAVAAGHWEM